MADKYDDMIDAVAGGRDKYDDLIDSAMKDAPSSFGTPPANQNYEVAGRSQPAQGAPTFAPQYADQGEGVNMTRAMLTNEPTQGFTEGVLRGAPAAIGGAVGALATGIPTYGAGSIAGAGLGGAGGEGLRQMGVQGYAAATGRQMASPGQVAGRMAIEGGANALGQGVGMGVSAAATAMRPTINKLGAQVIRVGSGVSEKYGLPAMQNPSRLLDAPTKDSASAGYQAFERYTGLTGLKDAIRNKGRFPSEGELEKSLFEVAARARNRVASSPQELYHASQAASSLKQMGKLGNPRYAALASEISDAKNVVDDALESALPEYKNVRGDWASAKMSEQFNSWLPLNQNQSPNALRSVLAGREAIAGTVAAAGIGTGNPAAMLALPAISPKFYGTALKGAALAGQIPQGITKPIYRVGTSAGGSALADAYMGQR